MSRRTSGGILASARHPVVRWLTAGVLAGSLGSCVASRGTLHVRVVDPDGLPVAGALVATRPLSEEKGPPGGPVRRLDESWKSVGRTDADGRLVLQGVPEGPLRVAGGAPPAWCFGWSDVVTWRNEVTVVVARCTP